MPFIVSIFPLKTFPLEIQHSEPKHRLASLDFPAFISPRLHLVLLPAGLTQRNLCLEKLTGSDNGDGLKGRRAPEGDLHCMGTYTKVPGEDHTQSSDNTQGSQHRTAITFAFVVVVVVVCLFVFERRAYPAP